MGIEEDIERIEAANKQLQNNDEQLKENNKDLEYLTKQLKKNNKDLEEISKRVRGSNETNCPLIILLVSFIVILIIIFSYASGYCDGSREVRKEAVKAGSGSYIADERGSPKFVWVVNSPSKTSTELR